MPDITLRDCVHDLTRRHIRHDGPLKGQWEDALLEQLEEAVSPSKGAGGAAAEGHAPVNIKAMDVQRDLAKTVRRKAIARNEEDQRPVPDILHDWAENDPDHDQHLAHVLLDIIDEIRAAIEPQVKPIPLDQACPDASCGKRRVREQDETGAWVNRPALLVHCRDEQGKGIGINHWTARCASCGREWHGAQELAWLGRMLADTPEREGIVTPV